MELLDWLLNYLQKRGPWAIVIIEGIIIYKGWKWWLSEERPRLSIQFESKEGELKELMLKYSDLCKKYQSVVDKCAARLVDIRQLKEAHIHANQKVIDLVARGVSIKAEFERVKMHDKMEESETKILENGK